jgi:predicted RNase H-like HicB family nuclease
MIEPSPSKNHKNKLDWERKAIGVCLLGRSGTTIKVPSFRERLRMDTKTLHFRMERFDDEDGVYYVIEGANIGIVTDGETIEQALRNLREAVELYFDDEEIEELPAIEVTLAVTEAYA